MTPMYLDYDTYFEYHDQTYIIIEKVANYYG
ncbi:MAG: toxin, partial [Enterococcus faecalis]|nr:toxin [Enterococcus faecalis]MDU3436653.1 toxin [Enterococcus faecalis]MDU3484871.1 toxin [Enterococcus faecalis]